MVQDTSNCSLQWAAVSALSLAVQLAFCVFNCFSFILFLSKLNDDDDDDDDDGSCQSAATSEIVKRC